jgi:multiple sugar transport system permease protein
MKENNMATIAKPVSGQRTTPWYRTKSVQGRLNSGLSHLAIWIVGLFFFIPWLFIVSASLKTFDKVLALPVQWIPNPVRLMNYVDAVTKIPFMLYMGNTMFIAFMNVLGTILSSAMVAYSFSRIRWPGRNAVFTLILATMMLPAAVTMIPLFIIFTKINWINTYYPLVIPPFFGNPFYIFLLRQFFAGIPSELSDAARIDGCSEWDTFLRIILPLSTPALAAVAILTFQASYNDLIGPLLYLTSDKMWTLSLGIQKFVGVHGSEWHLLMAASVLMTLPMIILFLWQQKAFVQGIVTSGLKG